MNVNKKTVRKTIVVIFRYKNPMVGLKDIMQRIEALSEKYNLIIVTNHADAFSKIKNKKIIIVKKSLIAGSLTFLLKSRWKLLFEKYDAIFLTSIGYSPVARMLKTKPIVCYGNVNPLQITGMKNYEYQPKENFFFFIRKYFRLRYLYFCLKKCDYVPTISKQLVEEYKKNGIPKNKIDLIYMGVDDGLFYINTGKKNKKFTIVYPGTISEERGLSTILEGLEILSHNIDDFTFKFIGCNDKEISDIREKAKKLGINKYVECLPVLDIKESAKHVRNADVGISILENNEYFRTSPPTKVYEYMACGLPTVANRIETHTDYIKDGYNGLIIENKPEEFCNAILRLHNNETLRKKMSVNAYNSSKKYAWNKQKEAFLKAFSNILKSGKK